MPQFYAESLDKHLTTRRYHLLSHIYNIYMNLTLAHTIFGTTAETCADQKDTETRNTTRKISEKEVNFAKKK